MAATAVAEQALADFIGKDVDLMTEEDFEAKDGDTKDVTVLKTTVANKRAAAISKYIYICKFVFVFLFIWLFIYL